MRPIALGLSLTATAAVAASDKTLAPAEPMVRSFLGYDFDVGPMVAGLLACVAVRFYVAATEPEHRKVDYSITAIALMFTAGIIMRQRPEPLTALMIGTGSGALGVGFIQIALTYVKRGLAVFDPPSADDPKPPTA